jgi:hypothetical protein
VPYHSYDELIGLFMDLEAKRPDVVSHDVIGASVQGRRMYLFKIGEAGKPSVFFEGSIHGNEHPGAELLLLYADWLVNEREAEASKILRSVYTLIVPVVNPDGFESYVRVNANCVDLNRNFPKGWGGPGSSPGMCCEICRGDSPLDQPESRAVMDVVERYRPLWALDIHSGTEAFAYPWSCWMDRPPDYARFESVCEKYKRLASERGVAPYAYGQISWRYPPIDMAVPVRVPVHPYMIYVCCGTSVDSWYDRGVYSMVLEAASPYNPPYDTLKDTYFPRFLPVAITLSREAFTVAPDWWWIIATGMGMAPLAVVGGILASHEALKISR